MNPGAVFIGGFVLAALAFLVSRSSSGSSNVPKALPPPPPQPDPNPPLPILDEEADKLETESIIKEELDASSSTLPTSFPSALPGVSDAAWTTYVKMQKSGKLNTITKSNNMGLFLLGYRILQDLGYVTNARKVMLGGRQVWTGDFVPPLTKEKFLSDALIQYEAFARMTVGQARVISAKYGAVIKGSDMTLSGLLAVAKFAGMGGMDAWMTNQATRKPETTAEFKRCNGIF